MNTFSTGGGRLIAIASGATLKTGVLGLTTKHTRWSIFVFSENSNIKILTEVDICGFFRIIPRVITTDDGRTFNLRSSNGLRRDLKIIQNLMR